MAAWRPRATHPESPRVERGHHEEYRMPQTPGRTHERPRQPDPQAPEPARLPGQTRASDRPRDRQARGSSRHSEQPSRTARHPVLPQTRWRCRRREPARVQPTPRQNRDRFYPSSLGSSKHLCPPRRPPRAARIIKNGTTTPGSGCPIHRFY